ncbi:hypothetical protein KP509_25G046700 [Ceratopteris richardii]|uniref:S-protein homolog n=1 Tax=Ceratopteris richardii TaxID=49495 RepID=A0A8T2RPY6_CERRI|nr:hypothetical protein KP509_25G046700 [Ceratopteris richardii]
MAIRELALPVLLATFFVLLLPLNAHPHPPNPFSPPPHRPFFAPIVVKGRVLGWRDTPVKGATVVLKCGWEFIGKAYTGWDRNFRLDVNDFKFRKYNPVSDCKVIVKEPFNGADASLEYERRFGGAFLYSTGDIFVHHSHDHHHHHP